MAKRRRRTEQWAFSGEGHTRPDGHSLDGINFAAMAYHATVVEVFIASPGDTNQERLALSQAVSDWNSTFGRQRGVTLEPFAVGT